MRFLPPLLLPATLLLTAAAAPLPAQHRPTAIPPQPGRYTPLDQRALPGQVGRWNILAKPSLYGYYQPVRVLVPSSGTITFYTPQPPGAVPLPAPAQAGLLVGGVYRLRVSDLPEFPGLELYPTIEVTDRLHPPAGREEEFPIPVEITREEIDAVRQDRLVTKVIYLERPQTAAVLEIDSGRLLTYDLPAAANLLDAADQLGRPVAILRLGGRLPDPHHAGNDLIGPTPPIRIALPSHP